MKFVGFVILLAGVQLACALADQIRHQQRRHLLEPDTECILYLRIEEFIDQSLGSEETWTCRFERGRAKSFGGHTMPIEGVSKEFLDSKLAVSGETILRLKNSATIVEQSTRTNFRSIIVISESIPLEESIEIEPLPVEDPRHHQQQRKYKPNGPGQGHRILAKSKGTLKTLVVRVIDVYGTQTATAAQLRDDIFTDSFNMKTQFAACSKNQMIIEEGGIVDVTLNIDSSDYKALEYAAKEQAELLYGGSDGLAANYDLVMFYQPPGPGFGAYAYINSWDSYYGDPFCQDPGFQMHEIGHNIGLGHSMMNGDEYGDYSTMMGTAYMSDDGPVQCFNAANNYQLGWYELQQKSIRPMELQSPQAFVLNGIGDYNLGGSSGGELVVLRLEFYGGNSNNNDNSWDYYLGYDRASGPNIDGGGGDVMLIRKEEGGPYGYSNTDRYNLPLGYEVSFGTTPDVIVRFESISSDGKDARVVVWNSDNPIPTPTVFPTKDPTTSPVFSPTQDPTRSPTFTPTPDPTRSPTFNPTKDPTRSPTSSPTKDPTESPSFSPTQDPTRSPTFTPTQDPTKSPVFSPTKDPTESPSFSPTQDPTRSPTFTPTQDPTTSPVFSPTKSPTRSPTFSPTQDPTRSPTFIPTQDPTKSPVFSPTKDPTESPSFSPTQDPTRSPTFTPTQDPTTSPLFHPTKSPTRSPTFSPTHDPTRSPTFTPTQDPTTSPTFHPAEDPTPSPMFDPTRYPTPSPTSSTTSTSTDDCIDDPDFRFKGKKKKDCKWVGKGKEKIHKKKKVLKQIRKKCKKKQNKNMKVWDYCKETCALVGMGPCAQ